METSNSPDPRQHTANVKRMLGELIDHLREDIGKFDEPKAAETGDAVGIA
jgi:hypothetical protein